MSLSSNSTTILTLSFYLMINVDFTKKSDASFPRNAMLIKSRCTTRGSSPGTDIVKKGLASVNYTLEDTINV